MSQTILKEFYLQSKTIRYVILSTTNRSRFDYIAEICGQATRILGIVGTMLVGETDTILGRESTSELHYNEEIKNMNVKLFNTNPRNYVLQIVEDGLITADHLLLYFVEYMSHDDVRDVLDCNDLSPRFDEDSEDNEDNEDEDNED